MAVDGHAQSHRLHQQQGTVSHLGTVAKETRNGYFGDANMW